MGPQRVANFPADLKLSILMRQTSFRFEALPILVQLSHSNPELIFEVD